MKALVIGGLSMDTLIYTPEIKRIESDMSLFALRKSFQIGGTGMGKALMMAKFTESTTLVCQAAKEDQNYIEDTLKSNGITPIVLETNTSEKHTNIMHGKDHRLSIFTSFPEDSTYINEVVTDTMLDEADIIFLNINSFCKPLIPRLSSHKEKVVVDLHDYQPGSEYHNVFLDVGAYLFTSCINLKHQEKFLENSLIGNDLKVSVVTCNKDGAIGMDVKRNIYSSKALKGIKMVDSNGAGDAFIVGFMHKYIESNRFEDALLYGHVCGAFSCESQELIKKSITKEQIDKRYRVEKNRLR